MPVRVGQQHRSRSNRSESDSYTFFHPQSPGTKNLDASASFTSSTLSGGPSTSCLGYSDAEDSSHQFSDGFNSGQQSEARLTRNCQRTDRIMRSVSPAASTGTDSTESVEEDQSDPEWTVALQNKDKPGILIKFADV